LLGESNVARWRAAAIERIPELREVIASAENIFALWIDLSMGFARAYQRKSYDKALVAKIYSFADWCIQAPRGCLAERDPLTAVTVCFYEDIPTIPAARQDMPRWFTYEEVAENRAVFSYLIGDAEYDKLVQYMTANRRRYEPRDRPAT
jgi:hypothetical protein